MVGRRRPQASVVIVRARAQELVHRSDELRVPTVELAFALLVDAVVTFVVERRNSTADADVIWIRRIACRKCALVTAKHNNSKLTVIHAADRRWRAREAF